MKLASLGLIIFVTVIISPTANSTPALDNQQKLSTNLLSSLKLNSRVEILVHLEDQANLNPSWLIINRIDRIHFVYRELIRTAERSQARMTRMLNERNIRHRAYHIQNTIYIEEADLNLINQLARLPEVKTISSNQHVRFDLPKIADMPQPPFTNTIPANLTEIGVDKVWNELGVRGEGIVIAGQDSGYDWKHPALKQQYRGLKPDGTVDHNYSWHDTISESLGRSPDRACPPKMTEPCDNTGHGSHTMGTMVGDDGGKNKIGVAPKAKWIGCRNMDRGVGTPATYLECFEYFLAPYPIGGNPRSDGQPDRAPHIVNNSWVCTKAEGCTGDEFLGAIRAMKAAGILVVAAAGNDGPGCGSLSAPPGSYHGDALVVGAFNKYLDEVAFFSNRGPSAFNGSVGIDVIAPGVAIRSSVAGAGGYAEKSGTSMASPHVAGAAALLWSAKPEFIGQLEQTVQRFRSTAAPVLSKEQCGPYLGNVTPNAAAGYGMIDVFKLVQAD